MNDNLIKLLGEFFTMTAVPRSLGAFRSGAFYPDIERTWDEIRDEIHAFGWTPEEELIELFRKALIKE